VRELAINGGVGRARATLWPFRGDMEDAK